MAALFDDAQFERLPQEAERALRPFVTDDGGIAFEMQALIVTASNA